MTGLRFQVRFFHLGFSIRKPVRLFVVDGGKCAGDPLRSGDVRLRQQRPEAVAMSRAISASPGFRLLFHTDWVRDFAAFQGASYFRAVDIDRQYGMSQRGLAIDCGASTPEEFPDFVAYYLEKPAKDSSVLTIYGAARLAQRRRGLSFRDQRRRRRSPWTSTRRSIPASRSNASGIAPGTSMFLVGKNDRRVDNDWRPEIHDSDGLQIWSGGGEWIWRPLMNPARTAGQFLHRRAPARLRPHAARAALRAIPGRRRVLRQAPGLLGRAEGQLGQGRGHVGRDTDRRRDLGQHRRVLEPADKPQRGQELLYAYRLNWCRENPVVVDLARVHATRTGIGGIIGRKRTLFLMALRRGLRGRRAAGAGRECEARCPVISASRGRVEITSVRPLRSINGYRAMFDLALTDDSVEPINLRMYISADGQALSETWLYQYTPPPPAIAEVLTEVGDRPRRMAIEHSTRKHERTA